MSNKQILVIGAGVSGLTSAILLSDAGYKVTIWTKEFTPDTTSNVAGAYWYPYPYKPRDKNVEWSKNTYRYLERNVLPDSSSGVRYITSTVYLKEKSPDPWWRSIVDEFERPKPDELPDGYVDGYRIKTIIMDTSLYLPWLLKQLRQRGVEIIQRPVNNFNETFAHCSVVVNCTGLGARKLCGDKRLFPIRGQVLRAELAEFTNIVADENDENLAYIVPRANDIIVGGTAQPNDWKKQISPSETGEILRKVESITNRVDDIKILEEKVGLRPVRNEIRLEAEETKDGTVIHNYGHGGAGFTLSWGCAMEVVKLVDKSVLRF